MKELKQSKILIIDDSQDSIALLEKILSDEGYTSIHTTSNPSESLKLFNDLDPDLILLDLVMPELDGFEVLESFRQNLSKRSYLPVIVLSGELQTEARQRALSLGAKDFIIKPFDREELTLRIHNILFTQFLLKKLADQNIWLENEVVERTNLIEQQKKKLGDTLQKLESSDHLKTYLMQNISHELRTPLNGILGFVDLLTDENCDPEDRKMYAGMIRSSAMRLSSTMSNYMDAAYLASKSIIVQPTSFYLSHLLREEIRAQQEQRKKGLPDIQLKALDSEQEVRVTTDSHLVKKAFAAILDNALKFGRNQPIEVNYYTDDQEMVIEVVDQGIGMPKEAINKVFDLFIQLDHKNTRSYEGSGLGLSVAHGIIDLIGGSIKIITKENVGTTILMRIPNQIT